jgi:hypothetical protein
MLKVSRTSRSSHLFTNGDIIKDRPHKSRHPASSHSQALQPQVSRVRQISSLITAKQPASVSYNEPNELSNRVHILGDLYCPPFKVEDAIYQAIFESLVADLRQLHRREMSCMYILIN